MNDVSGTQRLALVSNSKRLNELSARTIVSAIRDRRLTAVSAMEACLERIAVREPQVKAWSFLDADLARERARQADKWQAAGYPLGRLHGLPVGVKDVFDTSDMPSEYGSGSLRGRRPTEDADAVSMLHGAGALIVGKTTTSEFGMYHPSPTHNPLDLSRSPGVSSAGSAAAVVDHMVPLALGTQHTASTTLPASFCGAFAFKPSLGFTSMRGSNVLVPRMAHVGLLARSVDNLTLFAAAFDRRLAEVEALRHPPRIGLVRGPGWHLVSPDARQALDRLVAGLPVAVVDVDLPSEFDMALEVVLGLLNAHLAHRFGALPEETFRSFCPPLQEGIVAGRALSAANYLELQAMADRLTALAAALFHDHDALITLSAPGEATRLEQGPGSGVMSMPWSLCGLPTVSLPLLRGMNGMPIGVQLVGCQGGDRNLLSVAAWLADAATLNVGSSMNKPDRILTDAASYRAESPVVRVNGRAYAWPKHPAVVICFDGCDPAYIEAASAAGAIPAIDRMRREGFAASALAAMPTFTNPNNVSIVCGVSPAVHGVSGNFYLDRVPAKKS